MVQGCFLRGSNQLRVGWNISGHVSFGIKNNYYRISLWLHSWIKVIHRLQFTLLFKIPLEIFKFIKLRLHQQGKGREVVSIPNNQSWIFNRCLFVVSGGEIDGYMSLFALKGSCMCSESQKASTRAKYWQCINTHTNTCKVNVSSPFSFGRIKVACVLLRVRRTHKRCF